MIAYGLAFLAGCAVVAVPMFVSASMLHADETARGEQTMGPGIEMFLGMLFAPIGGIFACGCFALFQRIMKR